jgi:hypothetical protein
MSSLLDLGGALSPGLFSWDLVIILILVIGALFYGLSLGRERVLSLIVASYIALAIMTNAPLLANATPSFSADENALLKIIGFLFILMLLFYFFSRSRLIGRIRGFALSALWQTMVFVFLQVAFLMTVTLEFLPETRTAGLSKFTHDLFLNDYSRTIWISLPALFLVLISFRKSTDPNTL